MPPPGVGSMFSEAMLRKAFGLFDKDNSGTIESSELNGVMSMLGLTLSDEELELLYTQLDSDGNGQIDFEEFFAAIAPAEHARAQARAQEDALGQAQGQALDESKLLLPPSQPLPISFASMSTASVSGGSVASGTYIGDGEGSVTSVEINKSAVDAKPFVAALAKKPAGKSYMPRFAAPEAYGKKKSKSHAAEVSAMIEAKMARVAAEKEKAKRRARQKRAGGRRSSSEVEEEADGESQLMLLLTIVLGVALTLFEALDFDVLLGILFMPFISCAGAHTPPPRASAPQRARASACWPTRGESASARASAALACPRERSLSVPARA